VPRLNPIEATSVLGEQIDCSRSAKEMRRLPNKPLQLTDHAGFARVIRS
jgi:hypothetical protein